VFLRVIRGPPLLLCVSASLREKKREIPLRVFELIKIFDKFVLAGFDTIRGCLSPLLLPSAS